MRVRPREGWIWAAELMVSQNWTARNGGCRWCGIRRRMRAVQRRHVDADVDEVSCELWDAEGEAEVVWWRSACVFIYACVRA
jgi:hypothetical protein